MKITKNLMAAFSAVQLACRVTRHVQTEFASIGQLEKNDKSPVTVADFAAQAVVSTVLSDLLGEYLLVGEESSKDLLGEDQASLRAAIVAAVQTVIRDMPESAVLAAIDQGDHDASAAAYWTLDPVDGTKGFLRGGQYAISLALIENGEVTVGVLGCPNLSADFSQAFDEPDDTGMIYYALKDAGCYGLPATAELADAKRVQAEEAEGKIRVCESVEAAHSKHDEAAKIVDALGGAGGAARLDSQCKYAVVARGQADAYLRLPTRADYVENIWDHAAGKLIAEEAGMIVSDITGKPLDFSHGTGLKTNRGVICANKRYHTKIIEAIESLKLF